MAGMAFNAPAVIDMLNGRSVRSSRTDMMDELYLAQEDGGLPTTLAADSAPVRPLEGLGSASRRSHCCGIPGWVATIRSRWSLKRFVWRILG
jgi:hypothetical protein